MPYASYPYMSDAIALAIQGRISLTLKPVQPPRRRKNTLEAFPFKPIKRGLMSLCRISSIPNRRYEPNVDPQTGNESRARNGEGGPLRRVPYARAIRSSR